MPSISRSTRSTPSRPRTGLVALALGVIAIVATALGITSWHRIARTAVLFSAAAARPDLEAGARRGPSRTGSDDELRAAPAGDEKAHLARREPLPHKTARARHDDRPDPRLHPMEGGFVVAVSAGATQMRSPAIRRGDRRRMAVHEAAPESVGHRAANPVRGPPARSLT